MSQRLTGKNHSDISEGFITQTYTKPSILLAGDSTNIVIQRLRGIGHAIENSFTAKPVLGLYTENLSCMNVIFRVKSSIKTKAITRTRSVIE